MTIYKGDKKAQQTKVVYSEKGTATVPLEAEEPSYCQKCEDGEDHEQAVVLPPGPQCRTCSLAICCLLTLLMAFSLAGLLYFAAKPGTQACILSVTEQKPGHRVTGERMEEEEKVEEEGKEVKEIEMMRRKEVEEEMKVKATYGECGVGLYPDLTVNSSVKEHMSADLATESETFEIPEFNGNHPATVLHDFTVEVTAYRDRIDHVCFLMKINTTITVPPKNLLDFIIRYKRGDYTPRAEVIVETMKVVQPAVDNYEDLGFLIEYLCHGLPTYWLIKVDNEQRKHDLRKRSVGSSRHRHRNHHVNYFNGRYRLQQTIQW